MDVRKYEIWEKLQKRIRKLSHHSFKLGKRYFCCHFPLTQKNPSPKSINKR